MFKYNIGDYVLLRYRPYERVIWNEGFDKYPNLPIDKFLVIGKTKHAGLPLYVVLAEGKKIATWKVDKDSMGGAGIEEKYIGKEVYSVYEMSVGGLGTSTSCCAGCQKFVKQYSPMVKFGSDKMDSMSV